MNDNKDLAHLLNVLPFRGTLEQLTDCPKDLLFKTRDKVDCVLCNQCKTYTMEIIYHDDNDIVGVCQTEGRRCKTRKFKEEELVIYEIDYSVLAHKIKIDGFTPWFKKQGEHAYLFTFGQLEMNDCTRDVHCFIDESEYWLDELMCKLCFEGRPFVFIVITKIKTKNMIIAKERYGVKFIHINDILKINDENKIEAIPYQLSLIGGSRD